MSKPDQSPTLDVLIEQVSQGDTAAFAVIVDRYKTTAYTTAYQLLKNREEAEEVTQDAFLNVFRYVSSYRGEAQFTTWLYRVVYNLCLTRLRRKSRLVYQDWDRQSLTVAAEDESAWEQLQRQDQVRYVRIALDQLLPDDRLVLTLHYLADKPVSDIAAITSWSLSAVKVRLHRARQRLEKVLVHLLQSETNGLL